MGVLHVRWVLGVELEGRQARGAGMKRGRRGASDALLVGQQHGMKRERAAQEMGMGGVKGRRELGQA